MWRSRKSATRRVDGVSLDTATRVMKAEGFEAQDANGDYARLRRPGTWFTMSLNKVPLQLTLAETADEAVEMQLGYGTFVLFDTGDLEDEADRIAEVVRANAA